MLSHTSLLYTFLTCVVTYSAATEVPCPAGKPYCECPQSASVCEFSLTVNYLQTFASYSVQNGSIDPLDGYVYNINANGEVVPIADPCPAEQCSPPQTVDGKSFHTFISINGLVPGPTLIVSYQQTVDINVRNFHPSEAVTIHWHGMRQYNTPWMDGIPFVSQCPIHPGDSFRYIFKAEPSGTFWYHGHVGSSRADGLYGALIIRELNNDKADYKDLPQEHTLVLADWWKQPYSDLFALQHTILETYYPSNVGDLPQPGDKYDITVSYDQAEAGPVPFFSSLINGRGRYEGVQLNRTVLSSFNVKSDEKYRFRVVGAQTIFPYRLSVDSHKLTLVAADGFLIQPIPNLDYIILHAGERYDFVVNANQNPSRNYWIRAETLEINVTSNTRAPFVNFNHLGRAVLHYENAPEPKGAEYDNIPDIPPNCSEQDCLAANCPFEQFHESYNITCFHPAQNFRLLNPSPDDILPAAEPDEGQEYFYNFGYQGELDLPGNINGRLFQHPTFALATQPDDLSSVINRCPSAQYTCFDGCKCTHIEEIPFSKTIRFVLTSIGTQTHPIHLHGHSFWVVDSGYGYYNDTTGFIERSTNDLSCLKNQSDFNDTDNQPCTTVTWRKGHRPSIVLNSTTPRMDTVLVPAGGYVVIHFRSDNPGYWFFHCHIQEHLLEGMAMIVAIDPKRQNPPPDGLYKCGNFNWTISDFNKKLEFDPRNPGNPDTGETEDCQCLSGAELAAVIACSVFVFVTLVSIIICCTVYSLCFKKYYKLKELEDPVQY